MNKYDYGIPDEDSIALVEKLIENNGNNGYLQLVLKSMQTLHVCLNCEMSFYPRYNDFHPNPSCPLCGTKLVRAIDQEDYLIF